MGRFHKQEIARLQLTTAVGLFLAGADRSSVITLAGAASGLLDCLVRRAGKEPFLDYARRVQCSITGFTPKRQSYSHHIDKRLGVVIHKHLAPGDTEIVELDLDSLAADAICRALVDYVSLCGQDEEFVRAFFSWYWINSDGPSMMDKYKSVPVKLKPHR